jgi:8-oxo-dGTP diphosphatase
VTFQSASASVVLVDAAGQVLMQLRDDRPGINNPGCWAFPGGTLNPGEDTEAAARREFFEETGCQVGEIELLKQDVMPDWTGQPHQRTFFWSVYDGRQLLECREVQALEFIPVDRALTLHICPGVADLIPREAELAKRHFDTEVQTAG